MALQSLILPIISLFRSAGISQAANALRGLTGQFGSLSSQIGAAAASFSAFQALSSARAFTVESIQATARFERNLLGLSQVFEQMQPRMVAFTKEVESYGLSQAQAAQASVFLGSVLKQYGFSVVQSADQTERLVMLSQDLATTYGYDVSEALLAITALFRGEYDPIEKFGVAMKQNEVNARLAAQGLGDLEGAALANAQAIARLEMLFERAGDAIGAFERASNTLYGSQQRLNAVIGNIQLAFGQPFQEPLAAVNNLFADLAQEFGPDVIEIGESIAATIDAVIPIVAAVTRTFFELLSPLQQLIDLLNFVITIFSGVFSPIMEGVNGVLGIFNDLLDLGSAALGQFGNELDKANSKGDDFKGVLENLGIDIDRENSLERLSRFLNSVRMGFVRAGGATEVFASNLHLAELGAITAATEATNLANKSNALDIAFRGIATGAKDAEGKLGGLAGVFQRIDEAADKSEAKQAMEDLGLSAAFIEEVLTRPNWEEIFRNIAYYASLAAIEINKVFDGTGEGVRFAGTLENIKRQTLERINKLFGADTKKTGTKTAQDFFQGLTEEVEKQNAAFRLKDMGASEGLIQAILGTDEWEKTYRRILAGGTVGLEKLQAQFNKTAAGIQEMADVAKKAQDEFDKLYKEALDSAEEYIKTQEKEVERLKDKFLQAESAANDFKQRIEDFRSVQILPNIEEQLGRFEQAVLGSIDNIRSELKSAFRDKLIYQSDFDNISAFVATEGAALRAIAKQRDEVANKLTLSEALIKEYQRALTGALQLTSLLNKLKGETEKRTVTEVQRGVITLGRALREFEVVVTRSYEEPIQQIQNKTEGLIQGFRDIAQKSRDFADNLRKLRALGLDPMLFAQLVEAGAEAGGETAQAIVDGGKESVNELNAIFNELNELGAELGLDVGMTMYEAGKDMTFGLLEGIKSEQEALLATARAMAEAFSREFESKLRVAVDIPVQDAKQAFEKAQAAVPDIKELDTAALDKIVGLLQKANQWLGMTKNVAELSRTRDIIKIYESLIKDITEFRNIDVSGISRGMSVEALREAAISAGGQTIYNIQLEVFADSRNKGAAAGEEIINKLESFTRANGGGGGLLAQVL